MMIKLFSFKKISYKFRLFKHYLSIETIIQSFKDVVDDVIDDVIDDVMDDIMDDVIL